MSGFEQLRLRNNEDIVNMQVEIFEKTGISLDEHDPAIAMFLVHHRWLEDFYSNQSDTDEKNAKEIFTALSPLIRDMRDTLDLIDEKSKLFQEDIFALQSFREEVVTYVTIKAREITKNEVSNAVYRSIKDLQLKTQLIFGGVVVLQLLILLLLGFKVL